MRCSKLAGALFGLFCFFCLREVVSFSPIVVSGGGRSRSEQPMRWSSGRCRTLGRPPKRRSCVPSVSSPFGRCCRNSPAPPMPVGARTCTLPAVTFLCPYRVSSASDAALVLHENLCNSTVLPGVRFGRWLGSPPPPPPRVLGSRARCAASLFPRDRRIAPCEEAGFPLKTGTNLLLNRVT